MKNTDITKVEKIKNDYLSNKYTNREIANKYSVDASYISKLNKRYGWDKERVNVRHAVREKAKEKLIEKISDNIVTVDDLSDKLLSKIETAIEQLGSRCAREKHTVTAYEYNADGKKTREDELIKECFIIKQADIIDAEADAVVPKSIKAMSAGIAQQRIESIARIGEKK